MSKTRTLEALMERAAALPEAAQEELVAAMTEAMAELEARHVYPLSDGERQAIDRGLTAMRRGKFASDERIAAIFRKARSRRA